MILAIGRAERFSPNSVEKDAAILEGVADVLRHDGYVVETVGETALQPGPVAEACLSMGRLPQTLAYLTQMQARGSVVVNSPAGIDLCCNRRRLTEALRMAGVPVAPAEGSHGYWLKRGSGVAESRHDVQFAATKADVAVVMEAMRRHGVDDIMVSAHVEGDLLKFYGVHGTGFFRYFYPGDDGVSKFGDERLNGRPHHYIFDESALRLAAERASRVAGVDVYGGDCIVRADGSVCLIDFNDWPSFSRCRDEAAQAIAKLTADRLAQTIKKKRVWHQIF